MDAKQDKAPSIISQNIESLIAQLKQEGVNAGKEEADNIINTAKKRASELLNEAQLKSKRLIEDAHQQILREKKAAEDALQLAARNMRLELRQNLMHRFAEEVGRIVHKELNNEALLRELIVLIAQDTKEQLHGFAAKEVNIQLPEKVLSFEEIRKNPKLLENDSLKELVQSITHQMLKAGMSVTINPDAKNPAGIKVHLIEEDIVLDLSEEAVSCLLVKHMQPRFRALLEGLLQ
ncbi:hypothetical protein B1207_00705 [Legionella quinlivanii]|uniref:V-type ATP synthase subunit E n=1 Tax=Legionella quinlivanii TaxID=45073 RepID=A0A364LN18_9GAMM|nr:hypothetical protein [Legionella quinlivanii]RAP38443.1 hypothetical protein B1207_00705 [Legionella quinlivanii]